MIALQKFLLFLFGLLIGITTSVLVLIKGWGMQPKSWFWIIGVYFFGHIFSYIVFKVGESIKEKK